MEYLRHRLDHQKRSTLPKLMSPLQAHAGFSLIEFTVTITLISMLTALAMPSMTAWSQNGKVQAVGESLQNGLRLAQLESLRRNR